MWVLLLLWGCKNAETDTDEVYAGLALEQSAETGALLGAYSAGSELVLVGGDFGSRGVITHYDGESFCVESDTVEGALWWVHGRSPTDWYAVGENGMIVHEQAGSRTREDVPTAATLFGVYDDGTDVWAVGGDVRNHQLGEIWRKPAGGSWELQLGEIEGLMFKVHDGWFVGDGKAFYWDGTELLPRHPDGEGGRPPKLLTVRSLGPEHAFAVGGQATPMLFEYVDGSWQTREVKPSCGGNQGLNGIYTATGETIHIAGHFGAASTLEAGEWRCDSPPQTSEHFHVVMVHNDEVVWAGGDLFATGSNHGTVAIHPAPSSPLSVQTCP